MIITVFSSAAASSLVVGPKKRHPPGTSGGTVNPCRPSPIIPFVEQSWGKRQVQEGGTMMPSAFCHSVKGLRLRRPSSLSLLGFREHARSKNEDKKVTKGDKSKAGRICECVPPCLKFCSDGPACGWCDRMRSHIVIYPAHR